MMEREAAIEAMELEVGGGWVTPDVSYIDPSRRFCAYCGRPIARRYWARPDDAEEAYCDADHAARHATYPQRGANE